jgi:hypothetical protein
MMNEQTSRKLNLFDVTNLVVGGTVGADIYIVASLGSAYLGPASLLSLAVPCSESEHLFRSLDLMNPARCRLHDCLMRSRLKAYSRSSSVVSTLGSGLPITRSLHSLPSRSLHRWLAASPNSSCSQRSTSQLSILPRVRRFLRCESERRSRRVNALTLSV